MIIQKSAAMECHQAETEAELRDAVKLSWMKKVTICSTSLGAALANNICSPEPQNECGRTAIMSLQQNVWRVNGELFPQFYCQFLPRSLLQGEITLKARKLRVFCGRYLIGCVRWWLCFSCVQFYFTQVSLISVCVYNQQQSRHFHVWPQQRKVYLVSSSNFGSLTVMLEIIFRNCIIVSKTERNKQHQLDVMYTMIEVFNFKNTWNNRFQTHRWSRGNIW